MNGKIVNPKGSFCFGHQMVESILWMITKNQTILWINCHNEHSQETEKIIRV